MNLIKRHKGLAIVCLLSLILLVIIFAIFSRMIFSTGKGEYGDRLNGIVPVNEEINKSVVNKLKENEMVEDASVRVQGKIIYMTIVYGEKVTKDKAKEIASKTLESYDKEVLESYDFEFALTQHLPVASDGVDKSFVVFGNKHPNHEKISWTKN